MHSAQKTFRTKKTIESETNHEPKHEVTQKAYDNRITSYFVDGWKLDKKWIDMKSILSKINSLRISNINVQM